MKKPNISEVMIMPEDAADGKYNFVNRFKDGSSQFYMRGVCYDFFFTFCFLFFVEIKKNTLKSRRKNIYFPGPEFYCEPVYSVTIFKIITEITLKDFC